MLGLLPSKRLAGSPVTGRLLGCVWVDGEVSIVVLGCTAVLRIKRKIGLRKLFNITTYACKM